MTTLKIVEAKWFPGSQVSVKAMFEPVFHWKGQVDSLDYETFRDAKGLQTAAGRVFEHGAPRYLYVASHGTESHLYGTQSGEPISRTVLRNALRSHKSKKIGLFAGACDFGASAEFLLNDAEASGEPNRIDWFAGYTKDIDWGDSTIVDVFFWRHLLFGSAKVRGHIEEVARVIRKDMPIAGRLGFNIYRRKKGSSGGTRTLIEW